jgi:hypothetical protein
MFYEKWDNRSHFFNIRDMSRLASSADVAAPGILQLFVATT